MDTQTAIRISKELCGSNFPIYREALEYLIDHRDDISRRIYVLLPGGLTGNADQTWNKVKTNTESRCGCGNERILFPSNLRSKLEPGVDLMLEIGQKIYIRPIGSDKEDCAVMIAIESIFNGKNYGHGLQIIKDPFLPINANSFLAALTGYPLEALAEKVNQNDALFLKSKDGQVEVPLLKIISIDTNAPTVTIILDKDMELFDPENEPDRHPGP